MSIVVNAVAPAASPSVRPRPAAQPTWAKTDGEEIRLLSMKLTANNPNAPARQQDVNTQQGQRVVAPSSPSVDDSKTPAVITPKKAEPVVVQYPPTKPKTTAKRKSRRHHRRTRAVH